MDIKILEAGDNGFDNISYYSNGEVSRLLAKLSTKNLLHPFQTFILGQYNFAPKIAHKYNIKLIFTAKHILIMEGHWLKTSKSLRDKSFSYLF